MIEDKVLDLIAHILEVEKEDVTLDTAIGDLPEWDSLHHLQIISALEKEFTMKFNPSDLAELEEVADFISLIEEQQGV